MRNFYVPPHNILADTILLAVEERHHIVNVLRLQPDDRIRIFDSQGNEYLAVIQHCKRDAVVAAILEHRYIPPSTPQVTLFQGLPKFDKFDAIVQKTTELGVNRIVPVICQRSVPRMKRETAQKRVVRWLRIAHEASKQCGRAYIPVVQDVTKLVTCLENLNCDLCIILWEEEHRRGLKSVLLQHLDAKSVGLFVGPEGGFTSEEVDAVIAAGVIPITLGSYILRTETAAIVGLALILYELGGLGHQESEVGSRKAEGG